MTVSIGKGYGPSYLLSQVAGGLKAGYYHKGAHGNEPPGQWWGDGLAALGLSPGTEVDPVLMGPLFTDFTDCRTGEQFGRKPPEFGNLTAQIEARLAQALAAEPDAMPERVAALTYSIRRDMRTPAIFLDLTWSVPKDVSLYWMDAEIAAMDARKSGDEQAAEFFQARADKVKDIVARANDFMLGFAQDEAGFVRTGAAGIYKDDGHSWIVASFEHHISRGNDPQLHRHNAVLNRVPVVHEDGTLGWLSLDGAAIFRQKPALAAVAETYMRGLMTDELGVEWDRTNVGNGWQLRGETRERIMMFSKRSADIGPKADELAEQFEDMAGRDTSSLERWKLYKRAVLGTRPYKARDMAGREEELQEWKRQRDAGAGAGPGASATTGTGSAPEFDRARVIRDALDALGTKRATWRRGELYKHLAFELPGAVMAGKSDSEVRRLLDSLTLEALRSRDVLLVSAPAPYVVPDRYRRKSDGQSRFTDHGAERFALTATLDQEQQILGRAAKRGGVALDPDTAARAVGADRRRVEERLFAPYRKDGRTLADHGDGPLSSTGLGDDQAAALYGLLTSGRMTEVLVAAAGTGKTYLLAELSRIWERETGKRVVGLSLATTAARQMKIEGVSETYSIADWTGQNEDGTSRGHLAIEPGSVIVVDEASTAPTAKIREIQEAALRFGARVLLIGDPYQLESPGQAGGMFSLLAKDKGTYRLLTVKRFSSDWEGPLSLRLREGDAEALQEYDEQGRIESGSQADMELYAARAHAADLVKGRSSLLMAHDLQTVARLAALVRSVLVDVGRLAAETVITLSDGNRVGVGDLVQARYNRKDIDAGDQFLANRDVLMLHGISGGRATLSRRQQGGGWTEPFTVPVGYLREHTVSGYASTIWSAEGATVDHGHVVVSDSMSRPDLYVGLTRGRHGSWAYVSTDRTGAADLAPEGSTDYTVQPEADPIGVLASVLEREGDEPTVTEAIRQEQERATSHATLAPLWRQVVRDGRFPEYDQMVRAYLSPADYERYRADPERDTLHRKLRAAELAGKAPAEVLDQALAGRSMERARSVGAVVHGRVAKTAGDPVPMTMASYADRTPELTDQELAQLANELASALDERTAALGSRVAEERPAWAVSYLGEVPDHTVARADWERRAGMVAAWREETGFADPDRPLGAAPERGTPEQRASWHAAYTALGAGDARFQLEASRGALLAKAAAIHRADIENGGPEYVAEEARLLKLEAHSARIEADLQTEADPELAASANALADLTEAEANVKEAQRQERAAWIAELDRRYHAGELEPRAYDAATATETPAEPSPELSERSREILSWFPELDTRSLDQRERPAKAAPEPGSRDRTVEPEAETGSVAVKERTDIDAPVAEPDATEPEAAPATEVQQPEPEVDHTEDGWSYYPEVREPEFDELDNGPEIRD